MSVKREFTGYRKVELPKYQISSDKDINKIDKQNNIFGCEERQPFPIYISKEQFTDHMELLLINEENKNLYFNKISVNLYTIKLNTMKESTFVCTVYSVLVLKKY